MPKSISADGVDAYRRDGYYFPVPALSATEVSHYRECLEKHERKTGERLQGNFRHKAHLLFTWVDELVHHPKIVDAAEDILAPISCAGRRTSSSRSRTVRVSCPGIRTRSIGD